MSSSELVSNKIDVLSLTISSTREFPLKGKDQNHCPPCTDEFQSAVLILTNHFFTKQAKLTRRSTVLSLPVKLEFPASMFPSSLDQVSQISFLLAARGQQFFEPTNMTQVD
jgi:hypothetical protein